jgi:hypothetical protein
VYGTVLTPEGAQHFERLESSVGVLVEALKRIERLHLRWDAPLEHEVDDHEASARWAAVGSEAGLIAKRALRSFYLTTGGESNG